MDIFPNRETAVYFLNSWCATSFFQKTNIQSVSKVFERRYTFETQETLLFEATIKFFQHWWGAGRESEENLQAEHRLRSCRRTYKIWRVSFRKTEKTTPQIRQKSKTLHKRWLFNVLVLDIMKISVVSVCQESNPKNLEGLCLVDV